MFKIGYGCVFAKETIANDTKRRGQDQRKPSHINLINSHDIESDEASIAELNTYLANA